VDNGVRYVEDIKKNRYISNLEKDSSARLMDPRLKINTSLRVYPLPVGYTPTD